MTQNSPRQERMQNFKDFFSNVEDTFERLKDADINHKKFDDQYMLCICPGGRAGGLHENLVEIFYGMRPIGIQKTIKENGALQQKWAMEYGTTLLYGLSERGYVAIYLLPSRTENTRSLEQIVWLHNHVDPKKLLDNKFIRQQWKYLNSYMECTSIDGNPSRIDRMRCWYMRNFKYLTINEQYNKPRFYSFLTNTFQFILNVGLSGFIIFLLTVLPAKHDDKVVNELQSINKNLQTLLFQEKKNTSVSENLPLMDSLFINNRDSL